MLQELVFGLVAMTALFVLVLLWITFIWKGPQIEEQDSHRRMHLSLGADDPESF